MYLLDKEELNLTLKMHRMKVLSADMRVVLDQFVNKEQGEIFTCPICTLIVRQPVSCSQCEALFCQTCLKTAKRD